MSDTQCLINICCVNQETHDVKQEEGEGDPCLGNGSGKGRQEMNVR